MNCKKMNANQRTKRSTYNFDLFEFAVFLLDGSLSRGSLALVHPSPSRLLDHWQNLNIGRLAINFIPAYFGRVALHAPTAILSWSGMEKCLSFRFHKHYNTSSLVHILFGKRYSQSLPLSKWLQVLYVWKYSSSMRHLLHTVIPSLHHSKVRKR